MRIYLGTSTAGCQCDLDEFNPNPCTVAQVLTCSDYRNFRPNHPECFDQCLPACKQSVYTPHISKGTFPNNFTLNMAQYEHWPLQTASEIAANYANVMLYMKSFEAALVQEVPVMSQFQLATNIGGVLGLFVGASLLTWVEMMDLCVTMTLYSMRRVYQLIKDKYKKRSQLDH